MKRYLIATALMMIVGMAHADPSDSPKTYSPCRMGDGRSGDIVNNGLQFEVAKVYPPVYEKHLWEYKVCSYTVFPGNYSKHVDVYIKDTDGTNKKVVICDTHWQINTYLPYTCQAVF